jgi:acetate---CoA ligase (ADP-forming)
MLDALLYPKSVAVIGVSRTPGKVGHDIYANLLTGGFSGEVTAINPGADRILDRPSYSSLKAYGRQVDLGVIAVPRPAVMAAVQDLAQAGARAVVVISAGFKETGPEGAAHEKQLADFCRSRDISLLGPNCLGLINTDNGMNASFAGGMPQAGSISVITQSGALATAILDMADYRQLGLAKVVSIGNKAGITEVDLLLALARDEQTRVIVGYLEDISSGDDFVKAAEEASSRKPVVILKSGTTEAGQRAASSHTGVLAGMDIAFGAAFKRSGVIRADTFESLFDYATLLAMQPLPRGKRVLIITNAGGPGTMAADAVEKAELQVASLARNTASSLRQSLPAAASTGNPIDVLGDASPDRYVTALTAAQDDAEVDAVMVILTPQAMTKPAETARAIIDHMTGDKPVLGVFMGGKEVMPGRAELVAGGLPDYYSPERAVDALRAMCDYAAWRRRPPRVVTRFRVNRRRVERVIARSLRTGRLQLGEVRSKDILQAYGFRVAQGYLATSADEAVEIAQRIGYPVAVKIVSPDVLHKSDIGGVRLNMATADMVRDAFDLMMLRIQQRLPEARIEGVYVEQMVARGLEVIIGMTRDRQFGPMLMFGLGGIFVEVMKDVTFHLAPITMAEAIQMLTATRSYEMLTGARGQQGVDLQAIANGLQRISQLVTDFPQIAELDINPFIVGELGTEPFVADARMTLKPV